MAIIPLVFGMAHLHLAHLHQEAELFMLLIECADFNHGQQRFYQVLSLQDLFKTVKAVMILGFLKAAALYRLL